MEIGSIRVPWHNLEVGVTVSIRRSGPEWMVCMHGIQGNRFLFTSLTEHPALALYSILLLDLPGFGDSDRPAAFSYDVADQAEVVASVLSVLGVGDVHLVGHSLGGMIATLLALTDELNVISVCNLEGNLIGNDCGASREIAALSRSDFLESGHERFVDGVRASGDVGWEQRVACLTALSPQALHSSALSITRWSDSRVLLDKIGQARCPTLYIYGGRNREKAACLPDTVERVEIPGCGHFMMLEDPDATSAAIAAFVRRAGPMAAGHFRQSDD